MDLGNHAGELVEAAHSASSPHGTLVHRQSGGYSAAGKFFWDGALHAIGRRVARLWR